MTEELLKALPVYFSCLIKFVIGPIAGYGLGLHIITTILTTIAGTMTSVVAFTYFGDWLRAKVLKRWIATRKKFSPGNRRAVRIWQRFGLIGVAVLTPLLLTPIGGTVLAVSFGAPKEKILFYMLVSASFFAVLFSVAIYGFGEAVIPEMLRPSL
ncbi:MAG: hypothetical protein KF846_16380 [Cyclobacteriaceae bacterium]|nr:hypothetical protein [Cyclobacteriaceae bacterium]MBX2957743.1 hypothetical protein [Cyclobacteriaceae bacterium]